MLVPLSGRAKTRPTQVVADRPFAERKIEFSHSLDPKRTLRRSTFG